MWKYASVERHYIIAYAVTVKHISLYSSEGNIFSTYLGKKIEKFSFVIRVQSSY